MLLKNWETAENRERERRKMLWCVWGGGGIGRTEREPDSTTKIEKERGKHTSRAFISLSNLNQLLIYIYIYI